MITRRAFVKTATAAYNLTADLSESTDVAAANPTIVAKMTALMKSAHTDSPLFPLRQKKA